ncbi:transcriptional-regulating factor 1 isoform X2 [Lepisosteus oculatus]|uniref:transcriptional-regulating factor 1 isoform X2 n=1 Tax=Lepisosteus oculatus TaxID=7918 RepID=UPI0035F50667
MEDQSVYKTNHNVNCTDSSYFQHQQQSSMASMNHSYGATAMEPLQSSPVSPQFPHDSRDGSAVSVKGFPGMVEVSKAAGSWPGSANHHRNSMGGAPAMWGSPTQGEPPDIGDGSNGGGYQYNTTAQTSTDGQPKVTSSVLQKLDSFTQVFANQNLRIHQGNAGNGSANSMAQHRQVGVSPLASTTTDSTLRQLLSHKPPGQESQQVTLPQQQQPQPSQQRYQLEQQQVQRSFDQAQPKQQHVQELQQQHQQQQQLFFEYQQQQLQQQQQQQRVAHLQIQQALQQRQQIQSLQSQQQQLMQQQQQVQQQNQFYLQPQAQQQTQLTAHALVLQQLQQQQQHQRSTYYHQHSHPAMHQAQQQMQPPAAIPLYNQNRKAMQQQQQQQHHSYSQPEQVHSIQNLQLSSGTQYYFQEQQDQYRQLYQPNLQMQQQVQSQEDMGLQSPPKQYLPEPGCHLLSTSQHTPGDPSPAVQGVPNTRADSLVCQEPHPPMVMSCAPHQQNQRQVREAIPTIQLVNSKGGAHRQLHSPTAMWTQGSLSNVKVETASPDHSALTNTPLLEREDTKIKLLCSICQKEFKSLPALNGHMRSHGGMRALPGPKQEEGDTQLPKEVEPLLPIIMPVSVPVKLPLAAPTPDLSPTPCRPPDSEAATLVSPTSEPPQALQQQQQRLLPGSGAAHPSPVPSDPIRRAQKAEKMAGSGVRGGQQDKKKYRHRPEPLIIPSPCGGLSGGGATLFQSQLRSPRILGDPPPYTPPPMLSPVRQGSGLFSSVNSGYLHAGGQPTPITPRLLLCRASSVDSSAVAVTPGSGEQPVDVKPRINIGPRFQAVIPELRRHSRVERDLHKASLVWTPEPDLDSPGAQQKVDNLVKMACSSVLPGGGTNSEYALHCLFESRGNIMATLEKLLMLRPLRPKSHPLADYHYAGSDKWSVLEKKQLNKALAVHNKDFFYVQKMVKTKTVAQCVEYYYTWKKRLRLGKKNRSRLTNQESEDMASGEDGELESEELEEEKKSSREQEPEVPQSPDQEIQLDELAEADQMSALPNATFVCEVPNCGSMFNSRQALNGHARIHSNTNQAHRPAPGGKPKSMSQSGHGSVKSSPAHSTTSGDTDPTLIFPCKECGKVFFKIKSRNAHMKTHRQQEDPDRRKPQRASLGLDLEPPHRGAKACLPMGPTPLPFDHMSMVKRLGAEEEEEEEEEDAGEALISPHLLLMGEPGEYLPEQQDEL